MNDSEILQRNKLIALFMGAIPDKKHPELSCKVKVKANKQQSYLCWHLLRYHQDWNWLMPVVEKIEQLGASTDIHYFGGTGKHSSGHLITILGYTNALSIYDRTTQFDSKIEAIYNSVIKFIKWYNKQK